MDGQPLRLSSVAVFVDYGDLIEVQHAARGERHRLDLATADRLRESAGFRPGVLVEPFADKLAAHGLAPGSEAPLAAEYQRWYWRY
jgi:hypothetical protein